MAKNIPVFVIPEGMKAKLTDDEKKGFDELAKEISSYFGKASDKLISQDELSESVKTLFNDFVKEQEFSPDKIKEINETIKAHGLKLVDLESTRGKAKKTVEQYFKEKYTAEVAKKLKDEKGYRFDFDMPLNVKANDFLGISPNDFSGIGAIAQTGAQVPIPMMYEIIPGIQEAPPIDHILFQSLLKGSTNAVAIFWTNRKSQEGNAVFLGEGEVKPLMYWEYETETASPKKVAIATKVSTEMLTDFSYIYSEIDLLLRRELWREVNDKLLNGDGIGDALRGITMDAAAYSGTGLDGTIPMVNDADAIRACVLQMNLLGFRPNLVFVHPTVDARIDLTKDANGNYMSRELRAILAQVRIIPTIDIPFDHFLLLDSSRREVRIKDALRLEFGWENDDFRRNLVTIIAELRMFNYMKSVDAASCIYEEFDVVKGILSV